MEQAGTVEQGAEKEVISYANQKQVLVDEKALKLLAQFPHYKEIIDLLSKNQFMLSEELVSKAIIQQETRIVAEPEALVIDRSALLSGMPEKATGNFRVIQELDITGRSSSDGTLKDFISYFRDKFEFLSGLLRRRQGFKPQPLVDIKKLPPKTECDLIGMVEEKWQSKKGNLILRVEDLETEVIVVLSKDEKGLQETGDRVLADTVIGVRGQKIGEEMVIAKEVFLPDLPQRGARHAAEEVYAVMISDLHVGSKLFLEKEFGLFTEWLNGRAPEGKDKDLVGKIKYLFITGDCVDGVGIYPDQFDELAVKDIFEQYRKFTSYIQALPSHIQVFICPGQHDAVRRAEPQPALPKEFVPELSVMPNVHLLGSPSWVEVEGLNVLVYHGSSVHDLFASVNFLSHRRPAEAFEELLKRRDLMVGYGLRNPYVPEKKDYMMMRLEPDLFIVGDVHRNDYRNYRGCQIIVNGTWQTQTTHQSEKGYVPTPGRAVLMNLKTGQIDERRFYGDQ